jgi:hypothetical protein
LMDAKLSTVRIIRPWKLTSMIDTSNLWFICNWD